MTSQAVLAARLDRASARLGDAARPVSKRKRRQLKRRFDAALGEMTLDAYVGWINADAEGFQLMGADSWRAQGVTTALELARVLDAEHRRNVEKSERYDYGDDVPESVEWADYDPDC